MSNSKYVLFASTYTNITNVFTDLVSDSALNNNGVSQSREYFTSSLCEAVQEFQKSDIYTIFKANHRSQIFLYLLLENGCVQKIEIEKEIQQ